MSPFMGDMNISLRRSSKHFGASVLSICRRYAAQNSAIRRSLFMRKFLLILSLLILGMLPSSARAQNTLGATYEVYALSYGVYPSFPVSGLVAGADKDRKIDLQMMIWLVKGPGGRNILVDT